MPALHDYRCNNCGFIVDDSLEVPTECECTNPQYEITYSKWKRFNAVRDMNTDELVDAKGFRRKFNALEDPLCQIQLGLDSTPSSRGLNNFSPEQSQYFLEKVAREDSPKVRQEILNTYEANKRTTP